ncbi:hypothetical protein M9H77_19345 [Catharanthus roseus]|uniref:Uncharacterized protein n=1 Tax=Catharanthus roseus TaxID=4058 RepID=A0ACC0BA61_CATRO|nr:hypothetical protein M9H77_19345 [Catharanthus roseus]
MVFGNRVDEVRIMIKNTVNDILSEEQQFRLENIRLVKQIERLTKMNYWLGVFSGMINEAKLNEVILIVPTRECDFLTYRTKLNDETSVVVDVSTSPLVFLDLMAQDRRRPSGCIIQAVPNSCSNIIWVEHMEIPDLIIPNISRSIISSGNAYGAKHWVSLMKKQCARLASLVYSESKHNFLKLAEGTVLDFYGGVTTSSISYNWTMVLGIRIMIKNTIDDISSEEPQFRLENIRLVKR